MNARALAALCCLACAACAEAEELTATNFGRRDAAGATVGTTTGPGVGSASSTVASSRVATGSSTDSTAGTGGAAGSAGAGTSSVGGSGGTGPATVGAGGSSGAGGSGVSGAGGSAGSSGSGTGGAPTDAAVDRVTPPTTGLSVLYKCNGTMPMAGAIQAQTVINDAGPDTVPLSELTIRYYFTDEVASSQIIDLNFANDTGPSPYRDLVGSLTKRVVPLQTSVVNVADSYIEWGFMAGAGSIIPGDKVTIEWQYHGAGFPMLKQSNDYSFDPSKGALAPSDHVILARNGNVIWGTPP